MVVNSDVQTEPFPFGAEEIDAPASRVFERCDQLAQFSEDSDRITRRFCSAPMLDVYQLVRQWMAAAGMTCRIDAIGNLIGSYPSASGLPGPRLLIGSHLDTVPGAGRYDGILGVLLGLAVAEILFSRNVQMPFPIDVIAFSDEEGVRYGTSMLASRAVTGDFNVEELQRVDDDGVTMEQALTAFGTDTSKMTEAAYRPEEIAWYLEAHIEQGPVLDQAGEPLGIVQAIAGQTQLAVRIDGEAGHAGTVPMQGRRDAMTGAAELACRVEAIGGETTDLVATVGRLQVEPNATNVIPGRVRLAIDIRHQDDKIRDQAVRRILEAAEAICTRRELKLEVEREQSRPAVPMDQRASDCLEQCVLDAGYRSLRLTSGAGHDAASFATIAPTSMLFLRCLSGISHHSDEQVSSPDVRAALDVMLRFVWSLQFGFVVNQ